MLGTAHPRSRGENGQPIVDLIITVGSSPLTRGKPCLRRPRRGQDGLIPAHAGKTLGRSRRSFPRRAHPRSRGENGSDVSDLMAKAGSSPLTRGKLKAIHRHIFQDGLIPAHAGKTQSSSAWSRRAWAHPRSRGENFASRWIASSAMGSSPLTRGKQVRAKVGVKPSRLIPAHAGKTASVGVRCVAGRAHPRSRGENPVGHPRRVRDGGSSPLTRGKPQELPNLFDDLGLIPAHAGKTRHRRATC